jgi:hypothetical protein
VKIPLARNVAWAVVVSFGVLDAAISVARGVVTLVSPGRRSRSAEMFFGNFDPSKLPEDSPYRQAFLKRDLDELHASRLLTDQLREDFKRIEESNTVEELLGVIE